MKIDLYMWNWKKYPVIRIDLNAGDFGRGIEELFATAMTEMKLCAAKYGICCTGDTINTRFMELIANLRQKYGERVAVIIDEYDKPLLSTIDKPELHEELRSALKAFYGVLKSSDEHLKFVFLTGVSTFSKVSVFSDLNNLTDISLDERYSDLCGITQEELETNFSEEISVSAQNANISCATYLTELKRFYNGYRFSAKPLTVYNPFGLLKHFDNRGEFNSYWFEI